jgi:hypothetical protein
MLTEQVVSNGNKNGINCCMEVFAERDKLGGMKLR